MKIELYYGGIRVEEVDWPGGGALSSQLRIGGARVVSGPGGEMLSFGPDVAMIATDPSGENSENPVVGTLTIHDGQVLGDPFSLTTRPEFVTLDAGMGLDVLIAQAVVNGERVGVMVAPAAETVIRWEPRA